MASKIKMTQLLEEIRSYAEITNRRPLSQPGMPLAWMALRPQVLQATVPKRRLVIQTPAASQTQAPAPVKISFTPPAAAAENPGA